jgi:hypothetical protein
LIALRTSLPYLDSAMTPTFSQLPDLSEVREFGLADEALFAELREVLAKHDALGRFGVVALHQHFEIGAHERLVEFVDADART